MSTETPFFELCAHQISTLNSKFLHVFRVIENLAFLLCVYFICGVVKLAEPATATLLLNNGFWFVSSFFCRLEAKLVKTLGRRKPRQFHDLPELGFRYVCNIFAWKFDFLASLVVTCHLSVFSCFETFVVGLLSNF